MVVLSVLLAAVAAFVTFTHGIQHLLTSHARSLSIDGVARTMLFLVGSVPMSPPKAVGPLDVVASARRANTDLILFDPHVLSLALPTKGVLAIVSNRPSLSPAENIWVYGLRHSLTVVTGVVLVPLLLVSVWMLMSPAIVDKPRSVHRNQPQTPPEEPEYPWIVQTSDGPVALSLIENNSYLLSTLVPASYLVPTDTVDIVPHISYGTATLAAEDVYPLYEPDIDAHLQWHDADIYLSSSGGYATAEIVPFTNMERPALLYGRLEQLVDPADDTHSSDQIFFRPTYEVQSAPLRDAQELCAEWQEMYGEEYDLATLLAILQSRGEPLRIERG